MAFLRSFFSWVAGPAQHQPAVRFVLCQDAGGPRRVAASIENKLQAQGHDIEIKAVTGRDSLLNYLDGLKKTDRAPDAFFLDCCGVGSAAAEKVIEWYDRERPGAPLPSINFLSLATDYAVGEAQTLQQIDGRVQTGFSSEEELAWVKRELSIFPNTLKAPESVSLREVLNEKLGLNLRLDHNGSYYASAIKNLKGGQNSGLLRSWERGKLAAEDVITRLRTYGTGLATSLQSGLYGGKDLSKVEKDAVFYESTGFPVQGRAAFTPQEVENWPANDEKPVLVMQSYDPSVVPLLSSGKLGGIIALSPFMATHLKLLCEAHMVPGLFGLAPQKKGGLAAHFNEMAKPNQPPTFDGDTAEIEGKTLKRGQQILIGAGGNGLVLKPEKLGKIDTLDTLEADEKTREDLRTAARLNAAFTDFFTKNGTPVHAVKVNVDAPNGVAGEKIQGIGLVRTEQMMAADAAQLALVQPVLLGKDTNYADLIQHMRSDYRRVIDRRCEDIPVRLRLFDLTPAEVLDVEGRKEFRALHNTMDIHGGEALATWPDLYLSQVKAVLGALKSSDERHHARTAAWPLEIMMPAVKTEADVLAAKKLVEDTATELGIPRESFRFGVMLETLDACKNVGSIVKHCDFASFGTNDLTQEYTQIGRGNLPARAKFAEEKGYDPFKALSPDVLEIIKSTVASARAAVPGFQIDICGAQAADPDTAMTLFKAGINNISVAPSNANLYALPLTLNYRLYDEYKQAQLAAAAAAPAPQAMHQPVLAPAAAG